MSRLRTASVLSLAGLALLTGVILTAEPSSETEARALIARAITAHGGEANLTRFRAAQEKTKGAFFPTGREAPFTQELSVQLPDRLRNVLRVEVENRKLTIIQILDRDKGYLSSDGDTQQMSEDQVAEFKEALHLSRVTELVDLLKDKTLTLAAEKDSVVDGRPAQVVKVAAQQHRDILLFIDKASGLLVKSERSVREEGKTFNQEEFYTDFRDVDGVKRPGKMLVQRDGKRYANITVLEHKGVNKFDDDVFAKP